ncbi:MAG: TolC family protein [Rhodocyclaceae bacterium]|nr:TolC family protein [Rhodocyclaceae bacterium]
MKKIVTLCAGAVRLSVGLALVVSSIFCAESSWAWDDEIDRLLLQAMKQHPSVISATSLALGARADVEVARWQRWPTLSASAEMVEGRGVGSLALNQPLWTGGALTARIRSTEATSQAAELDVEVARQQLALRMLDAWQSLVSAHYSLERQENSLLTYARYGEMMRRRVEAKVSPGVDLELVRTRSMQAQTEANDTRALLRVSLARLEQLAGITLSEGQLAGLLEPSPLASLRSWAEPSTLERILKGVPGYSPVRKARLDAEAGRQNLKLAEAEQWPSLTARYLVQHGRDVTDSQFSLGFTYAPGAGLASRAQVRAQAARAEGLARQVDAVEQDLRESLRVDWEALGLNLARQDVTDFVVRSSREVLESYERQFVAGRKSWQDVLNALREMTQYEVSLAQSRSGAAAAYNRLRWRSDELIENKTDEPKEMQSP